MLVALVFDDWRQKGVAESIYSTELGVELSMGDFHSGTVFYGELLLDKAEEAEIKEALERHGAYPVFGVMVEEEVSRNGVNAQREDI